MRRREFIALVGGAIVCPLGVRAQPQAGKVPRIGFLGVTSASDRPSLREALRQSLRDLGWVEGRTIVIDYRYAEGRVGRLPDLAAELVRLKVDLIGHRRECAVEIVRTPSLQELKLHSQ
jgi:putative ABC transport system substrate-binding protein